MSETMQTRLAYGVPPAAKTCRPTTGWRSDGTDTKPTAINHNAFNYRDLAGNGTVQILLPTSRPLWIIPWQMSDQKDLNVSHCRFHSDCNAEFNSILGGSQKID